MDMSGYIYNCTGGETFDSIALEVYGDEKYAAELLCANPKLCEKMIFTGGEKLELPVVEIPEEAEEEQQSANAPWKG